MDALNYLIHNEMYHYNLTTILKMYGKHTAAKKKVKKRKEKVSQEK